MLTLADGTIYSLDFDWITGNIYAATEGGHILACDSSLDRNFSCTIVITAPGITKGVALNPVDG